MEPKRQKNTLVHLIKNGNQSSLFLLQGLKVLGMQTRRQSKSIQGARRFCGRARINIMTDRCSLQKTQLRQSTAACMANSINARRWQIIHINTHKQPNINHICIVCANKQTYKTFATLNHVLGKNIVACEQTSSLFTRICRK